MYICMYIYICICMYVCIYKYEIDGMIGDNFI